jgi:hypothetical protein
MTPRLARSIGLEDAALSLAHSYEFAERLSSFTATAYSERKPAKK